MKWKCWNCWLLTLTKCDHVGKKDRDVPCYKSAIQHVDSISEGISYHRCEDHAVQPFHPNHIAYTLLGVGRYRIPTKVSWVLLLLLSKFFLLPALGIDFDILPFIQIEKP